MRQFLLGKAGVDQQHPATLSGEEIVKKIASVDISTVLSTLQCSDIDRKTRQASIDTTSALSKWFREQYRMAVGARDLVAQFKWKR